MQYQNGHIAAAFALLDCFQTADTIRLVSMRKLSALLRKFMKLIVALLVLAALGYIVLGALKGKSNKETGSYRARKLMTDNELEFFGRLVKAVPEHYIFPQVALSAILQAAGGDKKAVYKDFLRIAQQRVDYLVCRADGSIVMVVELDDKTHNAGKDGIRDARLQQAGIVTLRFDSRNKPTIDALRMALVPPGTAVEAVPPRV